MINVIYIRSTHVLIDSQSKYTIQIVTFACGVWSNMSAA